MPHKNHSEPLPLVDADDQVIGQAPRGEVHARGLGRHRVGCVLVFNEAGELLIQKRSPTVSMYPNCWTVSCAGHVAYGDTYEATAVRELAEEVGITATAGDLELMGKLEIIMPTEDEFWQVYTYTTDQKEFTLQREEVSATQFIGREELRRMVEDPGSELCERARRLFRHFLFSE